MKLAHLLAGVVMMPLSACGSDSTGAASTAGGGGNARSSASTSGEGGAGSTGSAGGQGSAGGVTGAGGQGPGGAGPTGDECLALTSEAECEQAGCLVGRGRVEMLSIVDDQCVYEEAHLCRHASSLDNPGAGLSGFWRAIDGRTEVYRMSSFCDAEGLTPCLGGADDPHPDDPPACVCAGGSPLCE